MNQFLLLVSYIVARSYPISWMTISGHSSPQDYTYIKIIKYLSKNIYDVNKIVRG